MSNRTLFVVVVGMVLTATVVGTYGTTQIEGSRDVQIQIAGGDEQPYLGFDVSSPRLPNGNHASVPILTVRHTHERPTPLRITATVTGGMDERTAPNVTADPQPQVVRIGEIATLSVPVVCDANTETSETFTVTVVARGTDVSMKSTQDVTITCTGGPPHVQNSTHTPQ